MVHSYTQCGKQTLSLSLSISLSLSLSLHCRPGTESEELPPPDHTLVRIKSIYWKQLFVILGFVAIIFATCIIAVVSTTAWAVHNHNKQAQEISKLNQQMTEQNQNILEMQRQLAQQAKLSDGYLLEQLRQFEDNATSRISELEENNLRQSKELRDAMEKISEMEEKQLMQEDELRGAKGKISELEDEVRQLQEDRDILQTTKANQIELDQLSNTISVLSKTKANMTEFNSLLSNVSNLRETVSKKAEKDVVLVLAEDVRMLEAKALNESHYYELQSEIDMLKWSKVNLTDFEDLVSNVTSLAESTVRTSDFLQLSSALNVTHMALTETQQILSTMQRDLTNAQKDLYNATIIISVLQIDFEDLVSNVTSLADSTVRTSDFLQLSETVNDLESTTHKNISLLRLNFTNQIGYVNTALTGKADQHDVDMLTERVTTLSDTTVTLTAFETLKENVQSLTTSKADQTSLDQLQSTVNDLEGTTAKQQDLQRLDVKVSNHISSSQQTHSQHDSRISGNDGDIRSNTARIASVENDIKQLKDSTPGLTASWMIASMAVSMVVVCVY